MEQAVHLTIIHKVGNDKKSREPDRQVRPSTVNSMQESLEENGYAILENVVDEPTITDLIKDLSSSKTKSEYGLRNLLNIFPKVKEFSESKAVRKIAEKYLGQKAKVVRAIYFDKTPQTNWKVPWHQDLTISVTQKIETKGFTAWSKKAGIDHVQPPNLILEKMLTLRFHLDDAEESNGALKVLPKTHKFGRLGATEIQNLKSKETVRLCETKKGDCLLMKPLLLHSSSAGSSPKNRRVVHLEFSAEDLPNGLNWYGS
jgi:ectoine hydroxylase-related dioxygenase (phytanoyl-CoA dioxygenase family)